MRQSAADVTEESRVVKAVLHGDYNHFPDVLRQLVSLAPLGFSHPENAQIMAAYRASLSNGGNVAAHLEGDLALMLEIYRTSKEVEPIEDVIGDARRLLARACKQRLNQGLSDIDQSPSTAFKVLESLAAESKKVTSSVTQAIEWKELNKPVSYENNLLGDRFLERGQGLILFGPAGCGKSVAALQMCVEWAAGLDGFHLVPVRPLRIVIIQTEDSLDDTRETLAGIRSASYITLEHQLLIEHNLFILPAVPGSDPSALYRIIEQSVETFSPDIVSVNPLLAFCPGDPSRELGGILYQYIDPVIKKCDVGFLGIHHTYKTNKRDTSGYGRHDHQYMAAGDARVANWPRAMMLIEEHQYPIYQFQIVKRSNRSGWTDTDGLKTTRLFLKHSDSGVCWEQVPADDVPQSNDQPGSKSKEPRVSLVQQIASMNLYSFCSACIPEGESQREIAQRLENWLAQQNIDAKLTTCRNAIPLLVANQKLHKLDNGKYSKGPQA